MSDIAVDTSAVAELVINGPHADVIKQALQSTAIDAFERWGRGRAKAALNFGDCFSYALAASRNIPLLFVGDDFSATDVERA